MGQAAKKSNYIRTQLCRIGSESIDKNEGGEKTLPREHKLMLTPERQDKNSRPVAQNMRKV